MPLLSHIAAHLTFSSLNQLLTGSLKLGQPCHVTPNTKTLLAVVDVITLDNEVTEYTTRCSSLVFRHDVQADYVGSAIATVSPLHTNQLTSKLTSWKLTFTSGPNRHITKLGIDDLFAKYLMVVALLPDPTSHWGIQLASSFWQALPPRFSARLRMGTCTNILTQQL